MPEEQPVISTAFEISPTVKQHKGFRVAPKSAAVL
jgi:hypothetical protein